MTRIAIILGSTRPGRNGEAVARWVLEQASTRTDAEYELVDLRDHPLPHLDEEVPARWGCTPTTTRRSGRRPSRPTTASCS
ncbi:MAG TPA: NAD(P)H-dependent oxidoreductase [Candidatus Nanopelagicales bacterium]